MIFIAENFEEDELVQKLAREYGGSHYLRENAFGLSLWSVLDVLTSHPDISQENALAFLETYERRLREQSIAGGWDFLDNADYSDFKSNRQNKGLKENLKTAAAIEYKGIVFDEWTVDEETGGIWGEMCQCCAEKYKAVLQDELSDGGVGACSVKGCDVVGLDDDIEMFYVDFKPELIKPLSKDQLVSLEGRDSLDSKINAAATQLEDMSCSDVPRVSEDLNR